MSIKNRNFRFYLCFKLFPTLALQIQSVLIAWQIYSITKNPLSLGLIGLAEVIPNISVTLFGGHFSDHYNRKKIIISFLSVLAFISLLLSFTKTTTAIYELYFLISLTGICRGLIGPASFGLLGQIINRNGIAGATSWSTGVWQIAAMIGTGSSGFLYEAFGFNYTYKLCSFLLILGVLSVVLIEYEKSVSVFGKELILKSIKEGISFVRRDQRILGAMTLDMFAVLFGGAVALLPIFAEEVLFVGASGLGLLRAAPSCGAMLMAILLIKYPPVLNTGIKLLWSVFLFGVSMIFFALSKNFIFSLTCLFLSGAFDSVSVVIRSTIIQTLTPDHMRGRVSSVSSIFISSSNEIGSFESGVAAKLLGLIPSVVFGGLMTLNVVGFVAFKAPKLRKYEIESMS
jgi:MFS family permease